MKDIAKLSSDLKKYMPNINRSSSNNNKKSKRSENFDFDSPNDSARVKYLMPAIEPRSSDKFFQGSSSHYGDSNINKFSGVDRRSQENMTNDQINIVNLKG